MSALSEDLSDPILRVCIAQLHSEPGNPDANLLDLEACLRRQAGRADLVAFPECFLHGYGSDPCSASAEAARGPSFARIAKVAQETSLNVVYGFCELGEDGTRYIALNWVAASGELMFTYRKSHLWTPSPFESTHFKPGSQLSPVITLCGVRVATLICFDVEVVEPARSLALQGAQLLLVIGANADPLTLEVTVRTRAFENLCHLIYVNQMDTPSLGRSIACAPTGALLIDHLAKYGPDEAVVEIRPNRPEFLAHRKRNPLFEVRQPALYDAIAGGLASSEQSK